MFIGNIKITIFQHVYFFCNLFAGTITNYEITGTMRTRFFFFAITCLMFVGLQGQVHLFLEEQEVMLPDGKVSAWVFPLPGSQEEVLDDMKDYGKDRSDVKMKKEDDNLYMAEEVSIPSISLYRGDLLAYFMETDSHKSLAVAFRLGYDISLDSKMWADDMKNLRAFTKAFMAWHYEQSYSRRIEELEKQLKDLEKDRSKTEKDINNLNDKVAGNGKKIAKETDTEKINELEADIVQLEADARQLADTLPGLQSQIAELNNELTRLRSESYEHQATISNL